MKALLVIILLTGSSYASCDYKMITRLQLICEANELKKKEIKAIDKQTAVLEKILKEMRKKNERA